jgi:hypothetical protein
MLRLLLLLLLTLAPLCGHALLDQVSWEATRIMRVNGREIATRVNHTPTHERISAVLGGVDITLIMRGDQQLLWQLLPDIGVYGETALAGLDTPQSIRVLGRERLGAETVAGQPTVKYRMTFQTADGSRREGFYWENAAGVHLRSRFPYVDRRGELRQIELELRNVRVGAQPMALFELPADLYRIPLDADTLLDLLGV